MANGKLKVESIEQLIKAVENYQEQLRQYCSVLNGAGNICNTVMGNDNISKKYIENLENTVIQLQGLNDMADDIINSLIREKNEAIDIYDSIL